MKLIIYGMGKQAELTHYLFAHDSSYEVVAFCVDTAYIKAHTISFLGLPIIPFEELSTYYAPETYQLHIAVGQLRVRQRVFEAAKAQGYTLANYISSKAQVWPDLVVGENVFIDPVSFLHPFVTVGDNVMLIGVKIGHHSAIGSHVLISGATLGGNVSIGENTFIGMGAVVNENVKIGNHNIIGSGALLTKSTDDQAVYIGNISKKRLVDASRVRLFKN